jgi:branched-chain amino acid transport system permease protein
VAIPTCVVTSLVIERVAYRPLRGAPRLAPLITAIGVSIVLQTLAMLIWGRNYMTFPTLLPNEPIHLFGATVTVTKLLVIGLSALIMGGLMVLVNRSKLGRAMRATAENPRVAGLMGVNPNFVIMVTFAIGASLAAVAGVMLAATYSVAHFYMGFMPGLKAFTAAVLGGIGNIPGAMLGGLLLGLIEALGAGYIGQLTGGVLGSHYQDVFAFVVLCAVLILRPSGLLGERVADRA